MRVLHVQKVAGIGGSERHLLTLLPGLVARNVEVRMCVLSARAGPRFTEPLRAAGVEASVIRAGPDVNPWLLESLRREVRRYRPDIVHTHLIHGDLYGQAAARVLGVPAVSSVHSTHSCWARQPYRSAAAMGGRLASRTIAISEHVRRFVEAVRPASRGKIRVVPYGIDAAPWRFEEPDRLAARAEFGLTKDDIAVGIASRLIEHKGHSLLLEAHARAAMSTPNLRLLVAGDGPLRSRLEIRARRGGEGVRFLGFLPDIRRFMNACDVLVFPTEPVLSEGFGLAALEAMAAARPVVVTDVGALPEVVEHELTGYVVPPSRVEPLAHALSLLGRDVCLRGRFGAAGHQRAIDTFGLDRMVQETFNIYEEVARSC